MTPRHYKILNYALVIGGMLAVFLFVMYLFTTESQEPGCKGVFGSVSTDTCTIETVNNFDVDYLASEKRIKLYNKLRHGIVVNNVYAYTVIGDYIYAIGELRYLRGRDAYPDEMNVVVYSSDTDADVDFLKISKLAYLPKFLKIETITGKLSMFNTTAVIPQSEQNLYLVLILKYGLNISDLEVHVPEEERETAQVLKTELLSADGEIEWVEYTDESILK